MHQSHLQLKDQEKFRREMLFLDAEPEIAAPLNGDGQKPHAERPDLQQKTETQPLRPSAVK